jgi:hypothetical protein
MKSTPRKMKAPALLLTLVILPLAVLAADVTGTWKSEFDSQIGFQNTRSHSNRTVPS